MPREEKVKKKYFQMEVSNLYLKKKNLNTEIDILDIIPLLVKKSFVRMER
jgi:hypothetical protein